MVAREPTTERAQLRSLRARREAIRELVLRRSPRLPSLVKKQEEAFRRRVRQQITGDQERKVREYIRLKLEEPPAIRLRDKISFLGGVLGVSAIEFAILVQPRSFAVWYITFILPLLALRLWLYSRLRWHYFLMDFCYLINISCLVQVVAYPQFQPLIVANFAHATGPLAMAIPAWRNSLVFHSLDKITSIFVHALPALLLFCTRWYPPPGLELPDELSVAGVMRMGMLTYWSWQVCYVLLTEVVFRRRLSDPGLMTSIRWLTTPPYTGITRSVHTMLNSVGVMKPGEMFDSECWKTKLIFIAVQSVYTSLSLLPIAYLWSSFYLHLTYLVAIYVICVWNGSNYYIEVFSKAYRKQFEGDAATRAAATLQMMEAPAPRSRSSSNLEGRPARRDSAADDDDGAAPSGMEVEVGVEGVDKKDA